MSNQQKKTQIIMVWLLPVILIGGIFIPILGYIVFLMMLFFLSLSYFKGRYWCSHLCPRGAFLDIILEKISLKRNVPKIFHNPIFKWVIFYIFMIFFVFQFLLGPRTLGDIGFVFVRMCLLTTLMAIFLGIPTKARAWCMMCPMGTLQDRISRKKRKND